jgi:hypothetical protein
VRRTPLRGRLPAVDVPTKYAASICAHDELIFPCARAQKSV